STGFGWRNVPPRDRLNSGEAPGAFLAVGWNYVRTSLLGFPWAVDDDPVDRERLLPDGCTTFSGTCRPGFRCARPDPTADRSRGPKGGVRRTLCPARSRTPGLLRSRESHGAAQECFVPGRSRYSPLRKTARNPEAFAQGPHSGHRGNDG